MANVTVHAMKTCRGVEIQLHSINLSTRWRNVVSFMPQLLYPWQKENFWEFNHISINPQKATLGIRTSKATWGQM